MQMEARNRFKLLNPDYFKNYYEQNKETIKDRHKKYYAENKQLIFEKYKEHRNEKILCFICNVEHTRVGKFQHEATKKHQNNLKIDD